VTAPVAYNAGARADVERQQRDGQVRLRQADILSAPAKT
jgi:hypothetical protein